MSRRGRVATLLLAAWPCLAVAAGPLDAAARLLALAPAFEHGEGVPRDPLRAAALYCEAARLGSREAMLGLGWMYANGRGVARDDAVAGTLFAMAAYLGHTLAARLVHHMGPYRGEVPACLHPPPAPHEVAELWDVRRELASKPPARRRIGELVARLAPEYAISPRLALAVATAESALDPAAVSPKQAAGVMQLIPETAVRFRVSDVFDAEDNVRGGLAYLRWLLARYRGDLRLALAAYNAGEGAVARHGGVPPYAETRGYVARILARFAHTHHPYDPALAEASPLVAARETAP